MKICELNSDMNKSDLNCREKWANTPFQITVEDFATTCLHILMSINLISVILHSTSISHQNKSTFSHFDKHGFFIISIDFDFWMTCTLYR